MKTRCNQMIRHIVMWKFKQQNKDENMQMFKSMLTALEDEIDEIINMSVGYDVNHSEWDMALVLDVKSLDDLGIYKAHPKHQIVSQFCKRIRIDRCAVDFEITP